MNKDILRNIFAYSDLITLIELQKTSKFFQIFLKELKEAPCREKSTNENKFSIINPEKLTINDKFYDLYEFENYSLSLKIKKINYKDFLKRIFEYELKTIDINILRIMFRNGFNINENIIYKNTPLHLSCKSIGIKKEKETELVSNLLELGADINAVNECGDTPLIIACRASFKIYNYDIVKMLILKGSDVNKPNIKNGLTPLMEAICSCHYKIVELLLIKGANVNISDNYGFTPLYNACCTGVFNIIQILLNAGATDIIKDNKRIDDYVMIPKHWNRNINGSIVQYALQGNEVFLSDSL